MHIYLYIPPTPLMLESVETDSFIIFFSECFNLHFGL